MAKKLRRLFRRLARLQTRLLAAGLGVSFTAFGLQVAHANGGNTLTVTSAADSGGVCTVTPSGCTLRQAVADATSGDTITFNSPLTVQLTSGVITLAKV